MPRFVVLRHQMPPESTRPLHWDLMLEEGDHLITWALSAAPAIDRPLKALPLTDHRLEYLEYEGPLSGNRGVVSRHDWGTYEKLFEDDHQRVIALNGRYICGRATIAKQPQDADGVALHIEGGTATTPRC